MNNPFFRIFFSPFDARRAIPDIWAGFRMNVKLMIYAESAHPDLRARARRRPRTAGRARRPLRWLVVAYSDFFRGTPLVLIAFVTTLGLPALAQDNTSGFAHWVGQPEPARLRRHGARDRVLGLRHRGLPRGHRVGAPEPAHGRALARPRLLPDDALRGPAAGHPARHPAAAERLHRPAEGHRDHRRRRRQARPCSRRRPTRRRSSTSPATWSPRCSSCYSRSRWRASPTT